MLIEIFADFSCPWCYIGRRRLGRALAHRSNLSVQIAWQPFRLNPELPIGGADRRARGTRYAHDLIHHAAMERALAASGDKEGIAFDFDQIDRVPNTMQAHRLMRFAARHRREDHLAERLFSAYFEDGRDIGRTDTLIACAVAAGLERDPVRAFLSGDEETSAVATIDGLAHQSGIDGVPYFIFDRRFVLAGAQEPTAFLPLLDALSVVAEDTLTSVPATNRSMISTGH